MERSKLQFERLMQVDQQVRHNKYPNCFSLAKVLGVSVKTIQRDLDYMRDRLNAPLDYDPLKKGYYYTSGNWFLPALSLSEGDLFAVLLAKRVVEQYQGTPVAKQLDGIFHKIAESLPEKISIQPELVFSRFSFSGPPAKPVDNAIWTSVVRGLLHQQSVQIKYRSVDASKPKERAIDPYHVANLLGEWYVFAYDHLSKELRQFAIPRILEATLMNASFTLPDDFDPNKFLSTAFGRYAHGESVETVKLVFEKNAAPWVLERPWSPKQKISRYANGKVELSFPAAGMFEVCRWVLAWGHSVKVLAPRELKDMVREEVRLMAAKEGVR